MQPNFPTTQNQGASQNQYVVNNGGPHVVYPGMQPGVSSGVHPGMQTASTSQQDAYIVAPPPASASQQQQQGLSLSNIGKELKKVINNAVTPGANVQASSSSNNTLGKQVTGITQQVMKKGVQKLAKTSNNRKQKKNFKFEPEIEIEIGEQQPAANGGNVNGGEGQDSGFANGGNTAETEPNQEAPVSGMEPENPQDGYEDRGYANTDYTENEGCDQEATDYDSQPGAEEDEYGKEEYCPDENGGQEEPDDGMFDGLSCLGEEGECCCCPINCFGDEESCCTIM